MESDYGLKGWDWLVPGIIVLLAILALIACILYSGRSLGFWT